MDLNDAVLAHTKWKIRLKSFISGKGEEVLKPDQVAKDNLCELGKWIHGEGARLADHDEYQRLKQVHASFHQCAGRIVAMACNGKPADAEKMLAPDGEFTKLSMSVVNAINACKKIVR